MRVLHLSSGGLFGGVETFLITLARHGGAGAPMEAHFALTAEGRLSDELRAAGAPVHPLGDVRVRRPLSIVRARRRLGGLLRRTGCDVVVCHSPWAQALFGPPVRAASLPLVFQLHGHVTGRHWLERWARLTPPDLVISNSRFTAGTLGNLFPGVRQEIVRYPVAPTGGGWPAGERAAVRGELATPEGDVVIVQTSRLEPWKGHRLHLQALAKLRDLPGWTSWMVGGVQRPEEAAYLEELEQSAARYGIADRVRFVGQRQDVPRILAAADVHFQPNLGPEPFGIAFIEALYAGLPVVTTAIGGPREIVEPSCGILTPPDDADALAAALRELIGDPARRAALGAAGPARAAALCDPEAQVEQYRRALETARGLAGAAAARTAASSAA
ncbi:MAG TPA: glycosyltransferase family 4 protein [Longimicrobiaceae bacterium]|nr:glycosyltransferase family 4 protein [Longimicrobiaceae bacterium]